MLYDSVQHTLMALPDEVRVFPAHGAGSACGKNLSTERQSTIGAQRLTNYACAPMGEDEFVALVTEGQPPAPGYFIYDAVLNRRQHGLLDVESSASPLPAAEFLDRRARGAVVIDARDPRDFAAAHLRGSLNVPADGRFAERAGMVTEPGSEILVIAPPGGEQEIITRLGRIGFDTVTGYLGEPEAAFLAVPGEVDQASRLTASDLREALGRRQPAGGARRAQRRRARCRRHRRLPAHTAGRAARAAARGTGRPGRGVLRGGHPLVHRGQPAAPLRSPRRLRPDRRRGRLAPGPHTGTWQLGP